MESEKINEKLIDKKIDCWGSELNDFKLEKELIVEITLNEYRKLVKEMATKQYDIDKANKDKYSREKQINELKEENQKLKDKLLRYSSTFGKLPELEDDDE